MNKDLTRSRLVTFIHENPNKLSSNVTNILTGTCADGTPEQCVCVCVCMRVCVRVCAHACICACVCNIINIIDC